MNAHTGWMKAMVWGWLGTCSGWFGCSGDLQPGAALAVDAGAYAPDALVLGDAEALPYDADWYQKLDPTLVEGSGCDADLARLREATTSLMNRAVDSAFQTYTATCFPEQNWGAVATVNGGSGSLLANLVDPSRPIEFTGTNTQVADVDEPDFIKTDGQYFYVATPLGLKVLSAWPPETAQVLASVSLAGTPFKLFLRGTQLLVYTRRYPGVMGDYAQRLAAAVGTPCTYGYDCDVTGDGSQTSLFVLDVTDPTAPKQERRVDLTGSFIAARRVGSAVHTLVYDGARLAAVQVLPEELATFDPSRSPELACSSSLTYDQVTALFSDLRIQNQAKIAGLPETEFLPAVVDSATTEGPSLCERVLKYSSLAFPETLGSIPLNLLSLLSFDLTEAEPVSVASLVSRPGATYASPSALYVGVRTSAEKSSATAGPASSYVGAEYATVLHKFSFEGAGARYAGSGVALGAVLNQFAMDEQAGVLRVAASIARVPSPYAQTVVTTLKEQDGSLVRVGSVAGIAPGEDIRSVRFDGDRGYVVTFKKTDPLFVLDLADPAHPSILGELKLPGFSTYIHRMDASHLVTVGYDAEDMGSFAWFSGVRLQIIDVSDLSSPRLLASDVIGTRGSSSEALTNHLAFTYLASRGLLALPITVCEGGGDGGVFGDKLTFSGLLVYRATVDGTLSELGRIPHQPLAADQPARPETACFSWWTEAKSAVKRSFVFDDYVYSVSEEVMEASRLDDLGHPVSTVSFETFPLPSGAAGG
jgi:hypothetical protein